MIRQVKDLFRVECSNCKSFSERQSKDEKTALENAEELDGYAVSGKFHFCPSCFSDMLERWKTVNKEALNNVG